MSQVITNAFEQYWQSCLAAEKPVVLDEFILADIPNLDITSPIDPETGLPPESQIVHRQNVDQRGRINNNAVAYTIVMDTTVGDFSFNAMYLRNKANGVIGMIVYKGRETKLKTDQTTGQTGNSLVKSMLMGYDQAAEATLTHVDAGTWQIDYAARLRGMDEDIRQLQADLYGHHTFVGDGFKVVEKDGAYQVTQGVAIIGGLRVELKAPEVIHPGTKPIGVWVDVYRAGSLLSEHQNHFTIITSVADLADHVDSNGYQHYVAKLGTVQVDNTVVDGRGNTGNGGTGSIPDTFALWKRSMAEAGYDLIGQFGTEMTIETADQVILSRDGIEVFSWTGELPKKVTAQCSPVGEILWTRRTGELLYQKLSLATGSSLVGDDVDGSVAEALEKSRINVREVRNEALQRWNATGEIVPDKANMIDPEAGHKYDEMGAQYSYVADTCFVLEDFEYGPSASPAWNSRVFNALIKRAKGMFIASRTVDAIVQHDAPIDVLNRVTIMLPQSLRIRKTGAAIGSVVRTIKPAGSEMQSYTFNKDCLFNIIPEDNKINYAVYVNIIGGDFGGDGHSNKGIFDAPMAAYCTISRVIGSESSFFWSGLDNFQNTFDDIRSRFSNKHFLIDRGTSNNFSRVACDGGKDGTSIGVGFQLGCSYTTMIACAADKIQASYDFYGNAEVTMIGCGSEAFGRLIRVRDNAVAVVKGGKLEVTVHPDGIDRKK
ncbi:hypothetical protein KAM338_25060 [Aeromonas caviae]|nr:hypothetical protein KAM338_25060 [Aeromonas caviae]